MFDFEKLYHEAYKVYKNIKEREPDIFHEIVAFTQGVGILKCGNMEISNLNKRGIALYSGIGKCMVVLC